ncbi:isochorismate synthase [Leucobacter sp. GX24907]
MTRRLAEVPDILALVDPVDPLLWTREDRGCVGIGHVLRLEFRGPDRFQEAARTWREIAALAIVDDEVRLPGTGLLALGTFAFADDSASSSVLIVPRTVVARHRGTAWITEISEIAEFAGDSGIAGDSEVTETTESGGHPVASAAPEAPTPAPSGTWAGLDLDPAADLSSEDPGTLAYLDGVREASTRIARGDVEKVVLARQVRGEIAEEADLRVPLGRLADDYLDCWTFAIDGLVGASPETLIRSTDGAVSARVLAGTRARRDEPAADLRARDELLTSAKDQHEHAFAVQSVVTALSPYLPDLRTSEEPFALRLPNVWHLGTDLGATIGTPRAAAPEQAPEAANDQPFSPTSAGGPSTVNAIELVGALHPTAAVAGTPTADAVATIGELEPFDRGRYAGAVGWIDADGDGEWVIALRCAQVERAEGGRRLVTATAGGGIVAGSDAAHELAETVIKLRPITEAFA